MAVHRDPSSHAAAGITAPAIADAALQIVREVGVEGLSMRALADRLGVRAPSLYHHIANKAELLRLVARHAFASFASDVDAYAKVESVDDWIAVTRAAALKARAFYRQHPGLAAVMLAEADPTRDAGDGTRAALARAELDALRRLGVAADLAQRVFETGARWTLAAMVAEGAPHSTPARDAELFEAGLDLLLDGVRARLTGG